MSAAPFPGWHVKLFASRSTLSKGFPGLALGLWGPRRGSPCYHPTHLKVSSHSTGEIQGRCEPTQPSLRLICPPQPPCHLLAEQSLAFP